MLTRLRHGLLAAARRVAEAFPTIAHTVAVLGAAGFALEHVEDIPQVSAPNLRTYLDRIQRLRHADSTLVGLSDDEFSRGIRALERAVTEAAAQGPVVDWLTLLVMR